MNFLLEPCTRRRRERPKLAPAQGAEIAESFEYDEGVFYVCSIPHQL